MAEARPTESTPETDSSSCQDAHIPCRPAFRFQLGAVTGCTRPPSQRPTYSPASPPAAAPSAREAHPAAARQCDKILGRRSSRAPSTGRPASAGGRGALRPEDLAAVIRLDYDGRGEADVGCLRALRVQGHVHFVEDRGRNQAHGFLQRQMGGRAGLAERR